MKRKSVAVGSVVIVTAALALVGLAPATRADSPLLARYPLPDRPDRHIGRVTWATTSADTSPGVVTFGPGTNCGQTVVAAQHAATTYTAFGESAPYYQHSVELTDSRRPPPTATGSTAAPAHPVPTCSARRRSSRPRSPPSRPHHRVRRSASTSWATSVRRRCPTTRPLGRTTRTRPPSTASSRRARPARPTQRCSPSPPATSPTTTAPPPTTAT